MNHNEVYEDTCENKENEWMASLKNDVILNAFRCVRYIKCLEEITRFGMKISSTLPFIAKKCLID